MTTKLQLVEHAYAELGLAAWVYTITPSQAVFACERMDMMVADWAGTKGVRIAYNFSPDPAAEAGVMLAHQRAISLQLALALAPSLGKSPSEQTLAAAEAAWQSLLIRAAQPPQTQLPANMPRGAGTKPHRTGAYTTFMPQPNEEQLASNDAGTELNFKQE